MKKARRTEEQIIGIMQEHDAGAKCADLCRKHGMSKPSCSGYDPRTRPHPSQRILRKRKAGQTP